MVDKSNKLHFLIKWNYLACAYLGYWDSFLVMGGCTSLILSLRCFVVVFVFHWFFCLFVSLWFDLIWGILLLVVLFVSLFCFVFFFLFFSVNDLPGFPWICLVLGKRHLGQVSWTTNLKPISYPFSLVGHLKSLRCFFALVLLFGNH